MVSKEPSKCALTTSASEVEPAACLALEMKYALDPNRQIKKRNKALQVRFKDICEAQNEQRDTQLSSGQLGDKPASYRATYRKYMTVPARRSIPNVTKSTGVQTSPDLKKCYQTFPLDRKKGNLKGIPAADAFKSQNNGFVIDAKEKTEEGPGEESRPWGADRVQKAAALVFHSDEHVNALGQPAGVNGAEPCRTPDLHRCPDAPLQNSTRPPSQEPDYQLHGKAEHDRATPDAEEPAASAHGTVFIRRRWPPFTHLPPALGPPSWPCRTPPPRASGPSAPWPTRSRGRPHRPMGSRPRPALPWPARPRRSACPPNVVKRPCRLRPPRRTSTSLVRQRSPWVKNANKSCLVRKWWI